MLHPPRSHFLLLRLTVQARVLRLPREKPVPRLNLVRTMPTDISNLIFECSVGRSNQGETENAIDSKHRASQNDWEAAHQQHSFARNIS